MTAIEKFRLKCQEHFTLPCWDTKKLFKLIQDDGDISYFIVRELGSREDLFTEDQERDLENLITNMLDNYLLEKIRVHRVNFSILTLKLLLTYKEEIDEYQYYKSMKVATYDYDGFDHE